MQKIILLSAAESNRYHKNVFLYVHKTAHNSTPQLTTKIKTYYCKLRGDT